MKKFGVVLCLAVVCFSSFLFLFKLGNEAIQDYDEGIYAQVITNTEQSGNLLTLQKDGPWFEKPPLYFWEAMAAEKIFSSPEFSFRFPAALAGILTVVFVMLLAFEIGGDFYLTTLSGLILTLTPAFLEAGRQIRLDVSVVFWIVFSVYCFIKAQKNQKWYLGVLPGVALGLLTKSVIGFFPLIFILLWLFVFKKSDWLKNFWFWLGGVLGAAVVLPWHIYESIKYGPSFWNDYFFYHIVSRFEKNILGGNFTNFDYLHYLFVFGAPWTVLFVLGLWFLFKKRKQEEAKPFWVFSLFALSVLFIFGLAVTKLPYYLIPIFPFLALVLAFLLFRLAKNFHDVEKEILLAGIGVVFVIAFANTIYGGFHFQKDVALGQLVAKEEKQIGLTLLSEPAAKKIYTYQYLYWDTIRYYAKSRVLQPFDNSVSFDKPFLLIASKQILNDYPFSSTTPDHFTSLFVGQALVLLQFKP